MCRLTLTFWLVRSLPISRSPLQSSPSLKKPSPLISCKIFQPMSCLHIMNNVHYPGICWKHISRTVFGVGVRARGCYSGWLTRSSNRCCKCFLGLEMGWVEVTRFRSKRCMELNSAKSSRRSIMSKLRGWQDGAVKFRSHAEFSASSTEIRSWGSDSSNLQPWLRHSKAYNTRFGG